MKNKYGSIAAYGIVACMLISVFLSRIFGKDKPENNPNYFLKKELQNFYSDPTHSFGSSFWCPSIKKTGLTYWIDAVVVFTDTKYTSAIEAEKKFAEVMENYLKKLNSIPHIRPFLAHFPLRASDLSLSLEFVDSQHHDLQPPFYQSVYTLNDKCMFGMFLQNNRRQFQNVIEKNMSYSPYLNSFLNPPVERTYPTKEIKIPIFKNASDDPPHWRSMTSFMNAFAQEYHLFPLTLIPVGEKYCDLVSFGFAVWGKEQMTLNQAHLMAAKCARDFLHFIQTDKANVKFMKEVRSQWKNSDGTFYDPATIPEPRHFAFRISLWDEGINRQPSPYIAEIQYYKGRFKYFTSDEGQRLVLVHEETFDDAVKFLNTN